MVIYNFEVNCNSVVTFENGELIYSKCLPSRLISYQITNCNSVSVKLNTNYMSESSGSVRFCN